MKKKALVIGIDTYPTDPLALAGADAIAIAEAIGGPQFGFEVTVLLDEQATRRNVRTALQDTLADHDALSLVFFAGHAMVASDGPYLATFDGDQVEPGIDFDYLRRLLTGVADCPRVVLLDCCFSGAMGTGTPMDARSAVDTALTGISESRAVLAACRATETAAEDHAVGHGLFTNALLQGMGGRAADSEGDITVSSLYDYIAKFFSREGLAQQPVFKGDLAGVIQLGSGFPPVVVRALSTTDAAQVVERGKRYLDQYQERRSVSRSAWLSSGFRDAVAALTPIDDWFIRRSKEQPDLERHSEFSGLVATLRTHRARLATMESGLTMKEGIVGECLGEGSFGSVWRVKTADGLPDLAYKVLSPSLLADVQRAKRFEQGYRAMLQLDHPNIVKVRGLTPVPMGFFMDFIDGPNLRKLAGALEPEEAVELLLVVADTLRHAHGRHVIHRDVKPENIVVRWDSTRERWEPFLTDFDLAWFSTATRMTREALGSFYYAAPEQLSSPGSRLAHQETVDVYAFGQLMYFAMAQSDPTLGWEDNVRILKGRLGGWSRQSAASQLLELYRHSTCPSPKDRLSSFKEVWRRLSAILSQLRASGKNAVIDPSTFVHEVRYHLVGLEHKEEHGPTVSFHSRSKRTNVTLTLMERADHWSELQIHVRPEEVLFSTNQEGRSILNQRIDEAIRGVDWVRRKSGTSGSFEAWVHIERVSCDDNGVESCSDVVARVIDACERT